MATVTGERYASREGSQKYDDNTRRITQAFTMTYFVQGAQGDTARMILDTSDLPEIGDTLYGAPCRERQAREVDSSSCYWEVECGFDSASRTKDLYLEPTWTWDFETLDQVLEFDPVTAVPITNVMGEPLHPTAPISIAILTIEKYQNFFNPSTIFSFVNHVNSSPFWGALPGYALMSGIRDQESGIEREDIPSLRYMRKVQYVIKFRMDGWMMQLLNISTAHREPDDPDDPDRKLVHANLDASGNPVQRLLDKDGFILTDPVLPVPQPTLANGGWLLYNRYPRTNFNALSIGPW